MPQTAEAGCDFSQKTREVISRFRIKTPVYLDGSGDWQENPRTLEQCASHEILYQCWKLSKIQNISFFNNISLILGKNFDKEGLRKTASSLDEFAAGQTDSGSESNIVKPEWFLVIFRLLTWALAGKALDVNRKINAPDWNLTAQAECKAYARMLQNLNEIVRSQLSQEKEPVLLTDLYDRMHPTLPVSIQEIPKLLAEEDRLASPIESLLVKSRDGFPEEDIFPLIVQKLTPPTGVVTEISPAYLRPSMRLLMDDSIDVASGIPYTASVILSVLQDIRSTETILAALERYPFQYTKIRENLVYTLGSLKESDAVPPISQVLSRPDAMASAANEKTAWFTNLFEEKIETIQALGKIGFPSLKVLDPLLGCLSHPSEILKTHLAWSLGEIGKAQQEELGGVNADIIITLLMILRLRNKESFIESVTALKKIGSPELLNSLYLYDIRSASLLALKPSQRGLFELSETLHHLIKTKSPVVMAVNGDSGTGKTYFCQAIKNGFGNIKAGEILYLMRDRKKDQKIFNRILGLEWLKKHIDPIYYQDDPLCREAIDPDKFFLNFMTKHSDKKLIILDGCRDRHYFQRVIDLFYTNGQLDVAVNFRAAHSTRRFNLEEREIALESVKSHLSFLEEPALEDTVFYQQGTVPLYDLDNSIPHRLNHEEVKELFKKPRIDRWSDLIRLGEFKSEAAVHSLTTGIIDVDRDRFVFKTEAMPTSLSREFASEERKIQILFNRDLNNHPNLLGHIPLPELKPRQLRFYAQDQIAGLGDGGRAFVLSFLDKRMFSSQVEAAKDFFLLKRDMYIVTNQGRLLRLSFEKNQLTEFGDCLPPVTCLETRPPDILVTGHADGSIRIWNNKNNRIFRVAAHDSPINSLAMDTFGRIYSASSDNWLKRWDFDHSTVLSSPLPGSFSRIKVYSDEQILAGSNDLRFVDLGKNRSRVLSFPKQTRINDICVAQDGRIVAALPGRLAVIAPNETSFTIQFLENEDFETLNCLIMGAKILTCCKRAKEPSHIRIFGNEYFVQHELGKLFLKD